MFYNGLLNSCKSLGNIAKKGSCCQAKSDALSETCGFITNSWLVMSFHGAKTSSQKHQLLKQANLKSVAKKFAKCSTTNYYATSACYSECAIKYLLYLMQGCKLQCEWEGAL